MSDIRIGVLGAGVVGLTTAIELQNTFRNAQINIIADKFNTETTSYVAAGLFRPGTSFCGPTEEITKKWINDAYHYWDDLRKSDAAADAGVTQLSGYIFASEYPQIVRNHFIEKLVPLYRPATNEELKLCPGNWKYGSFFTTLLIEPSTYLPWATYRFKGNGGNIITAKVDQFSDDVVVDRYDVIVNCTGLGAKFLCNDYKLVPLRGQVVKVQANWIKTFFYGDYDTYIIPGSKSVTLGGCRQYDSYDMNVSKYDGLAIRERCEALLPSLKSSRLVGQYVGLRPHRDPVRVERETFNIKGRRVNVVHQYGHGGYGVTTAPGTALHAVQLVREALMGNSKL